MLFELKTIDSRRFSFFYAKKRSLFGNRQNDDWTFETNIFENVISISMSMPNFKILAQNTFTNNDSSV